MERTRHSIVAGSPKYNEWQSNHLQPATITGWLSWEGGARQNLDEYFRASSEVRVAALDHKINEIGAMVAAIYGSLGMTGQLPEQIKQAQAPQKIRPRAGFIREVT